MMRRLAHLIAAWRRPISASNPTLRIRTAKTLRFFAKSSRLNVSDQTGLTHDPVTQLSVGYSC